MVRIRKKILLAVCLAVLGMSLLLAGWLFPIGAQQQSVDVPSISYDLGFLGSGTELDDPLAQFAPYTLLSGEDDLLSLLGQLQSNCAYIYVDGEPVAVDQLDWDQFYQDVLSYDLFAGNRKVLAVLVRERDGGAADFDAVLQSCSIRGSRAWVNVETHELAASTASFHGVVYFIPCPKEISSVRVHVDRKIESNETK